jgi:hypothetical protein
MVSVIFIDFLTRIIPAYMMHVRLALFCLFSVYIFVPVAILRHITILLTSSRCVCVVPGILFHFQIVHVYTGSTDCVKKPLALNPSLVKIGEGYFCSGKLSFRPDCQNVFDTVVTVNPCIVEMSKA